MKRAPARVRRHGLARTLSKLGACSRTQAAQFAREGRITINGRIVRVKVSAKAIRNGMIVKPTKRKYVKKEQAAA